MNANQNLQNTAQAYAANQADRPEGHFTARVRQQADESEQFARRLAMVLQNLRGTPPPAVTDKIGGEVRSCNMGDHLNHAESSNKTIDILISEMEGLL